MLTLPVERLLRFGRVRKGDESKATRFARVAILDDLNLHIAEPPEGVLHILLEGKTGKIREFQEPPASTVLCRIQA